MRVWGTHNVTGVLGDVYCKVAIPGCGWIFFALRLEGVGGIYYVCGSNMQSALRYLRLDTDDQSIV
jgi:hypothetical protein